MKKMVDVEELLAVAIKTPEAKKPECSYSAPKCPKPSKAIVLGLDVEDSIAMATELEASLPTIEAEAPIAMELEASLPKEAEASIPMELEAPLLSEAEASIPKELESSLPSEAEASIPMELEKLPSEDFVKLPIVPDEADASILEEKKEEKAGGSKKKKKRLPKKRRHAPTVVEDEKVEDEKVEDEKPAGPPTDDGCFVTGPVLTLEEEGHCLSCKNSFFVLFRNRNQK